MSVNQNLKQASVPSDENHTALSDKVAALLSDPSRTAASMSALSVEVDAAATQAAKEAEEARMAALDPRLTSKHVADLRRIREDAEFQAERMIAAAAALRTEVAQLEETEKEAARVAAYEAAAAESRAVADQIVAEYPELARKLMALIANIRSATEQVVAANQDRPKGREPLRGPEGLARGFNDCAGTKHRREVVRIMNSLVAPFAPATYYAWPIEAGKLVSAESVDGFTPHGAWPNASDVQKGMELVAADNLPAPPTFDDPA
ncbi:hypothetical protein [Pararhodobacter marinus]|uniref:hypothetical protein n=1 Tax=Pararhodobacter marinus TaxID=2184063 RepID=UPI00351772F2